MIDLISCLDAAKAIAERVDHKNRLVNRYTARDFTPFRFMRWSEVPSTHMLAFFLDSQEDHGQGTLFQDIFFDQLKKENLIGPRLPETKWRIEAERRKGDYGQLDLLMISADRSFGICLENKPRDQTQDQPKQLSSYRKFLRRSHHENYLLIYLSRDFRSPDKSSLKPKKLAKLSKSGHYINLTYNKFILGLLDEWHQAVHPESLRTFLKQFRHQVEQWLQFESTKPAQLMQDQEIATKLASSASHVHTAFDITAAMSALKRQLLQRLALDITHQISEVEGKSHWTYSGFMDGNNGNPFVIRRPSEDGLPTSYPWGRYAVCLEFNEDKLFYGIRFDRQEWHPEDRTVLDSQSKEVLDAFSRLPGTDSKWGDWWPWWAWAGPTTDQDLYASIAAGKLQEELKPKVAMLVNALDTHFGIISKLVANK